MERIITEHGSMVEYNILRSDVNWWSYLLSAGVLNYLDSVISLISDPDFHSKLTKGPCGLLQGK